MFMFKSSNLAVFKCHKNAIVPKYSTSSSSCFDIHACLSPEILVNAKIKPSQLSIHVQTTIHPDKNLQIIIPPGARALIPTGLKFNIPSGYSLRLHPRSGLAFKNGIMLCNCEGVVDEDYVDEVFVPVYNSSNEPFLITNADRICQAELIKDSRIVIKETAVEPVKKTNRNGGFGSTGI